jgi:Tfp pilus assembly PilM family ATPase
VRTLQAVAGIDFDAHDIKVAVISLDNQRYSALSSGDVESVPRAVSEDESISTLVVPIPFLLGD